MTVKHDAIYARYSSHAQDDSTSIEVQLEQCERAAGGKCAHYIDRAKTGRTTAGRPELQRMLLDAEAGRIGRIFLYKFDRLGRAGATHAIVEDLEDHGCEVISVTEGSNALARGVNLVVAADYSRQLGERTRDGLVKRHEQRGWTGGAPPYGFKIVRDATGRARIAIDPVEAVVVRSIFEQFLAETIGAKKLASRLHAKGIPTRRGARWSFTTVRSMLANRMYLGEVRYGLRKMKLDRQTGRRKPKFNPIHQTQVYSDEALAVIDRETFDRAQEKIAQRANPACGTRSGRGTYAFTGFLFCEVCGSVYYSRLSKNARGEYRSYQCGCRQMHGSDACTNAVTVREDRLTVLLTEVFADVFDDADSIISEAIEAAEKLVSTHRAEATELRRQIVEIERQRSALTATLSDAEAPPDARRAIFRELAAGEQRLQELQQSISDLGDRANDSTERLASAVRQAFDEARSSFSTVATPAELHSFVGRFLGPMTVKTDGSVDVRETNKQTAPDESGAVAIGSIAGGGFEPPTSGL